MSAMKEVTSTVDVPTSTGVEGFLHAVREIVKQPRVQQIVISAKGRVSYTRLVDDDDDEVKTYGVDFGPLEPYAVIRNADTQELSYPPNLGACDVITAMLDAVVVRGLTPICFATGANTVLWSWSHFSSGVEIQSRDYLSGLPIFYDKQLPDTALVLCAGVGHTRALLDTRLAVKVEMQQNRVLSDDLEIL